MYIFFAWPPFEYDITTEQFEALTNHWLKPKDLTSSIYMHKLRTMVAYDSRTDNGAKHHGKNIEHTAVGIGADSNRI